MSGTRNTGHYRFYAPISRVMNIESLILGSRDPGPGIRDPESRKSLFFSPISRVMNMESLILGSRDPGPGTRDPGRGILDPGNRTVVIWTSQNLTKN